MPNSIYDRSFTKLRKRENAQEVELYPEMFMKKAPNIFVIIWRFFIKLFGNKRQNSHVFDQIAQEKIAKDLKRFFSSKSKLVLSNGQVTKVVDIIFLQYMSTITPSFLECDNRREPIVFVDEKTKIEIYRIARDYYDNKKYISDEFISDDGVRIEIFLEIVGIITKIAMKANPSYSFEASVDLSARQLFETFFKYTYKIFFKDIMIRRLSDFVASR